jgi:DNA invertase Pin-like site-specific DNA recombinase
MGGMKYGYARVSTDDQKRSWNTAMRSLCGNSTRLDRSLRDLITTLDDLRARGVKFHSLTEAIGKRQADRPRHVADDWRTGGTRTEFDFGAHPAPE